MIFEPAGLAGAWTLAVERHHDERGYFARLWCAEELAAHGMTTVLAQASLSYNRLAHTIRGLHYQAAPKEEAKIVRCLRGAIYDVLLDVRRESPTFGQWVARELTADNGLALYVPEGVAHGFQTLADDSEVLYMISEFHDPDCARGIRWDDPAFAVAWPHPPSVISGRDRMYPLVRDRISD
jgi:dTDP-4-dehydrorhamnose 3,5-epimerase